LSQTAGDRGAANPSGARQENRSHALLDAAASLFGSQGFEATSVRTIAAAAGMLPGSVYYHYPSKEELLLAVHEEGVAQISAAVDAALEAAGNDPWERLEAACVAHLEALLDGSPYTRVVTPEIPRRYADRLRATMIAQRDRYEVEFRRLVEALPLAPDTDRHVFRLALLGSLNWAWNWYRPDGGMPPGAIARTVVRLFREPLDPADRR